MLRRVHTPQLHTGTLALDASQSRHVRDVLRLTAGGEIEIFDDAGATAVGVLLDLEPVAKVRIDSIEAPVEPALRLTIASAVPKGERADWMIEKLSELGVWRFIPLQTRRSIVLPAGRSKFERWQRLARESARQSRRRGIMRIEPVTPLENLLVSHPSPASAAYLSTRPGASSIFQRFAADNRAAEPTLLIGPEGGWSEAELAQLDRAGLMEIQLTQTILRVETASIAAAAVMMSLAASNSASDS